MKRIIKLVLIMLLLLCITTNVLAAINANITLKTSSDQYSKDQEVIVEVNMSNVDASKGINAFGAVLDYDKTNLEYVKMEGKNGWDIPTYNPNTGRLITANGDFITNAETIFTITFKVKTENADNVFITLKNIEVGNTIEEAKWNQATTTIKISDNSSQGGNTQGGNTQGGNTQGGNTQGGNTQGGNTQGGNTQGGNTPGGNTQGGNTQGGNTPGGNTQGGNTPGGNTQGGNTPGGSTPGGNTQGGNTQGGNTPGSNNQGGSTQENENFATGKLPQTGIANNMWIIILCIAIISAFAAICVVKIKLLDKKKDL